MEHYAAIKAVHVTCVVLSLSLFAWRAGCVLVGPGLPRSPWLRALPHAIDTLLFSSAILLVVALHQYPFVNAWLTAKVVALLFYIVLGNIGLKRARTQRIRVAALIGAVLSAIYIVFAALRHSPWSFLA
jgi:uncharacterized membrane protein SirB2